ncbi:hypothetical protein GCM10009304_00300 [Pseudomonas matsuisoli]|uniref:Uncharacterized protein n=1 Tax=Pseudomonas matsuisoli TaxID=1515666 RepID=A0A917PH14_9PSED|nr:hypothetical protein GCM10009304_00300 [Pseudomonas matsuisoli]
MILSGNTAARVDGFGHPPYTLIAARLIAARLAPYKSCGAFCTSGLGRECGGGGATGRPLRRRT